MLILLLLIGLNPHQGTLEENTVLVQRVDSVEINHVYDNNGRRVLVQLLGRNWHKFDRPRYKSYFFFLPYKEKTGQHYVEFWVLKKDQIQINKSGNLWTFTFFEKGALRQIKAPYMYKTWTQYDREMDERNTFRIQERKGLLRK